MIKKIINSFEKKKDENDKFIENSFYISFFICLLCFIVILSNIIYVKYHSGKIEYWSFVWTGVSILPIPVSLVTFFWNKKKEHEKHIEEEFSAFQDDFFEKHAQTIIEFNPSFTEINNKNTSDKNVQKLTKDLVSLIYSLNSINSNIPSNNSTSQILELINEQVFKIIHDQENVNIINLVNSYYPELITTFDSTYQKNRPYNLENDNILGYWYMSEQRAKKAKYLIGVSTKTKQILGTFHIINPSEIEKNDANRLYFGKASESIYSAPAEKDGLIMTMPGLETWTAQNPIIYYKSYIESKGITLTNDNISNIETALKLSAGDFKKLNSDDIIIVRTYKFDVTPK